MPKERINMYLDRSRLELAQKKALSGIRATADL